MKKIPKGYVLIDGELLRERHAIPNGSYIERQLDRAEMDRLIRGEGIASILADRKIKEQAQPTRAWMRLMEIQE